MRAGIPFSNPPGLAYEYSNYGFGILGQVVAARVRAPVPRLHLVDAILQPLGMTATTLDADGACRAGRLALGYRREDNEWKEEPPLPDGVFGAMGGMLTSLRDLHGYVAFLMSAWPPRDDADTGPRQARVAARDAADRQRRARHGHARGDRRRHSSTAAATDSASAFVSPAPSVTSSLTAAAFRASDVDAVVPGHGVGLIAMGTVTYAGWGNIVDQATNALAATGAFLPREPQPSPALVEARQRSRVLIQRGTRASRTR